MTGKRAILIAGPTASGKSAKAIELALRHDGVIVNADSMQVYRELRIISARPSAADEASVPHRLYGMVPAAQRYSVGSWVRDTASQIEEIESQSRLPIIVGGTGLYFKALLEGLARIPDIPENVMANWRARIAIEGSPELHKVLVERDPQIAARLEPNDSQRITRALAVLDVTGRSLLEWQNDKPGAPLLLRRDCDTIYLDPERAQLYQRINRRFDQMMEQGGLDEIRALKSLGLDPALPAMRALGIPHLLACLNGDMDM
ncbi:MAG: tRNA (adenosine(37)-N6)-dimethylallyltransferase MiaA, partial [Fimbriimonadaceae bacterium]|nr:tRNA (adenosine(37)-N6)-dimethylallyltransferase MiaA [Alphaproteobacteria bacterium]